MTKLFEGKLIRFDAAGVGVVDVADIDEFVYFTPKQIRGCIGQTVEELKAGRHGAWSVGKTVIVDGDLGVGGNVYVNSVILKP